VKNFKFKFKYTSKSCRATGDGTCRAEDMDEAIQVATEGVAKDFGGSTNAVVITQINAK